MPLLPRRPALRAAAPCLLLLLFAGSPRPAGALDRAAVRAADEHETWARGQDCTIVYYNTCTGWIWSWSGWRPGDRVGTTFEACNLTLSTVWLFVTRAAPHGYGFTGTLGVFAADAENCPTGAPIASHPFLPAVGWNYQATYTEIPDRFSVVVEFGPGAGNPIRLASDHPALGPTGPFACGNCYPTTRVTRSFFWGPADASLCPGSPLFDGICNAELLMDVTLAGIPTAGESATWATIKSLYR